MSHQIKFCVTLGVHQFQTRNDGLRLPTRLLEPAIQKYIMKDVQDVRKAKGGKKKNDPSPKIKYLMGQGISVDTPEQAADLLLKREYPEIYNTLSGGFGTIAIPEGFIPSITKVIDQDVIDKMDEETRKLYQDMIKKFPGDTAERMAHRAIIDYYKKEKRDTVIVQGLEIINLSSPGNHRECDFIVVNLDKKYILNIEVKNFLGPWIWNREHTSKVIVQFKENLRL